MLDQLKLVGLVEYGEVLEIVELGEHTVEAKCAFVHALDQLVHRLRVLVLEESQLVDRNEFVVVVHALPELMPTLINLINKLIPLLIIIISKENTSDAAHAFIAAVLLLIIRN